MENLIQEITPHLLALATILITAITGYLATRVKMFFDSRIDKDKQEMIVNYVKFAVAYAEQIGIDLASEEKLSLAKQKVLAWAYEKGINITGEELEVLIEAFVHGLGRVDVLCD